MSDTTRKAPRYQARHYLDVADVLVSWEAGRGISPTAYESLVAHFAVMFKDDNPKFNPYLFYRDCKVEGY